MSQLRVLFVALVGLAACHEAPPSTTTLTSGEIGLSSSESRVASSIATARCGRTVDDVCSANYDTAEACLNDQRNVQGRELHLPAYCPGGLDEHQIANCASTMSRMPCGTRVHQVAECRGDWICPPRPEETKP